RCTQQQFVATRQICDCCSTTRTTTCCLQREKRKSRPKLFSLHLLSQPGCPKIVLVQRCRLSLGLSFAYRLPLGQKHFFPERFQSKLLHNELLLLRLP